MAADLWRRMGGDPLMMDAYVRMLRKLRVESEDERALLVAFVLALILGRQALTNQRVKALEKRLSQ